MDRLPPEMLCQVFFWLREANISRWPYPALQDMEQANISWIRDCTHICSRWRNAALAWPELWSALVFSAKQSGEEIVQMMLERSVGHPLRISWAPDGGVKPLCHAMRHIQRVSSLSLACIDRDTLSELVAQLPAAVAPFLRELVLQFSDDYQDHAFPEPFASILTGHNSCPALTRLHLSSPLPMDLRGINIPHFTYIELSGVRGFHGNSALDTLHVLASSPRLTELRIDRTYVDSQFQLDTQTKPVVLPKLESLHFYSGSTHKTSFLFHNIRSAQLLTSLTLSASGSGTCPKELLSALSDFYKEHQKTLRRNPFQTLTIHANGPNTFTITLRSALYNHRITLPLKNGPSYTSSDLFLSLFHILPVTSAQNFVVEWFYAAELFASENLPILEETLKEVTSLHIEPMASPEVLISALSKREQEGLLFPALRILNFRTMRLIPDQESSSHFLTMLRERQVAGVPLEKLLLDVDSGTVGEEASRLIREVGIERKLLQ